MMKLKLSLSFRIAFCLLAIHGADSVTPFLPYSTGQEWRLVGSLDMTDPTQQCPDAWLRYSNNRASCGKKSTTLGCDSVKIPTYGARYQTVCGRFRGYQVGSDDAFSPFPPAPQRSLESSYVDGISITYGPPGSRRHVYTLAAGFGETSSICTDCGCPCTGGGLPPAFVGSDYYCESGNPGPGYNNSAFYYSDPLWDGRQCGGNEATCCTQANLPWFCKNFLAPISEDLEIRICKDQGNDDENVAIEFFELYIQVPVSPVNIVAVFDPNNTLRHLEISWIPEGANATMYIVRLFGDGVSFGLATTTCSTAPCVYIQNVTVSAVNYTAYVTLVNRDRTLGSQLSNTTHRPRNAVIQNVAYLDYPNGTATIGCSFLNNQSFYCMVCCSISPSSAASRKSSVYNTSAVRGTEVTTDLKGLLGGQIYYCKAAATSGNSSNCSGPVIGDEKMLLTLETKSTSKSPTSVSTSEIPSPSVSSTSNIFIDALTTVGITIAVTFVISFLLGVLVAICILSIIKSTSNVQVNSPAAEPTVCGVVTPEYKNIDNLELQPSPLYEQVK